MNDTELLLKAIAGAPDDKVEVTSAGVVVNTLLLAARRPVARPLRTAVGAVGAAGLCPRLAPEVWLYAADDRSWDSRYWGPAWVADLQAVAVPLLIAPGASP